MDKKKYSIHTEMMNHLKIFSLKRKHFYVNVTLKKIFRAYENFQLYLAPRILYLQVCT